MVTTAEDLGTRLPSMKVAPPGPRSQDLAKRLGEVEAPTSSTISAGDIPVFWEQTRGANIIDADGNVYVDLTSGFCVAVAGHSNPRIVAAIAEQAVRMMHSQGASNPNARRVELAERLAGIAPAGLTMSHLANTGAEAVEMALKTARLATGRTTVVAFEGGFHGKTVGALSVTSQNYYRKPFASVLAGTAHLPFAYCYHCPFGLSQPSCNVACAHYVEHALTFPDSGLSDVAAVIVEPVQGHGGWIVPPTEFMQTLRRVCDQQGILLIADEIITGFGRTGKRFAVEHYDVVPDILVVAKGMASGFPISAMITRPELARKWKPLQHTSTFLGNPIGCAAALASISEIMERKLVERSATMGVHMKTRLEEMATRHPLIGDVRGLGSMMGLEIVKDRQTREPAPQEGRRVVNAALERGVMATNYGGAYHNVIKMSPPLVITQEQLDTALDILDESFTAVEKGM